MLIMGSTAIKFHFPDFPRPCKDIDYIVNDVSMWKNTGTEEYLENDIIYYNADKYTENGYLTKSALITLKLSHVVGWPINTEKHLWDIQWLKNRGCKVDMELFWKLYEYWGKVHGESKRSNLMLTSEQFFNNALNCEYDHDWLHTLLIKHPHFKGQEFPTYMKVLEDGQEVAVSEEKFNLLTFEEKCNLVWEECFTMSFERKFHRNYKISHARMLKKFMISHAPVWEALFIALNYPLLEKCPFDYVTFLNTEIENAKLVREINTVH